MERDRDKTIAYHEAGHAVAAWFLGVDVQFISIEPSTDMEGCVLYQFSDDQKANIDAVDLDFI